MVGSVGVTRTVVNQEKGTVFIGGELWRATAKNELPAGTKVRVIQARNLDIVVEAMSSVPIREERSTR